MVGSSTSNVADSINNLDYGNPLHVQNSDNGNTALIPFKLLLMYYENVVIVWKDLNKTYDKVDGSVVYNLLQKINFVKHGGSSVADYYYRLNSLWREFDALTKLSKCICKVKCSCDASKELKLHQQLMKLMPFLMGLDDCLYSVKTYLGKCFAMKDLGEAAYILGIKIYKDRSKRLISLCQSAYIEKILKRYSMENSKRGSIPMHEKLKLSKSQGASTPAETKRMQNVPYASAVGSIMYAVRCTRPDVAFAQNITSRFQQNPRD
nr:retrotransposon protein, putative, Ty1-copia subclass [Tanacetum cinerariifolium]